MLQMIASDERINSSPFCCFLQLCKQKETVERGIERGKEREREREREREKELGKRRGERNDIKKLSNYNVDKRIT